MPMRKWISIGAALIGLLMTGPLIAQQKLPVEQQKVSRLPPLPQPLDPVLQEMFAKRRAQGGAIINLQLTTGHSPKFSQAASTMAFAIRFDSVVPRRLIELTIMRTAQIVGSNYEINQHIPLFKMCGFSDAQLAALTAWKTSDLFDAKERAVLGYTEQMAHGGDVDDPTFAELQKYFPPRAIVELTYTIGNYYANGLLTKALRIQVETDGRETVAGKC
jgi:alkylhydroperoxidase family enzyme